MKLRVQAVGLNRAEAVFMRGRYMGPPELPSRIGYEAAGVVEAVGPGVDTSWIGKQVATVPGFSQSKNGVLGEEAIVPGKCRSVNIQRSFPQPKPPPSGCNT